jgi:hypothetical protein
LYIAVGLVGLGLVFDDLVREASSEGDPLLVIARWLTPLALIYAALRVVVESGIGIDLQPYQPLPVRGKTLRSFSMLLSLSSLWNVLPLTFLGTACLEAALSNRGGEALCLWFAGVGVAVIVTYSVPIVRRGLVSHQYVAAGITLLVVSGIGIEMSEAASGAVLVLDGSRWLIGGIVQKRMVPILVFSVLLVGVVIVHARWIQRVTQLDQRKHSMTVAMSDDMLNRLSVCGPAWRGAVLEVRRYLRHSQLRLTIFLIPFLALLSALLSYEIESLNSEIGIELIFAGLMCTGFHIIYGGPNLLSYEGVHIEALHSIPANTRHLMAGKWLFLTFVSSVLFFLPLPVIIWSQSPYSLVHLSLSILNIGMVAPLMMAASTFNRNTITLDESSFMRGGAGFSVGRAMLVATAFGVLSVPILLLEDPLPQFSVLGGLGLLSALTYPLWLSALATLYEWNRHAMIHGFRASSQGSTRKGST